MVRFSSELGIVESVNAAVEPLGVNVSTAISPEPITFTNDDICKVSPAEAPFTSTIEVLLVAV